METTEDNYDDDSFNDGFDDDALAKQMNMNLWRKLFVYAKRYPGELRWLAVFAFTTACAEVAYPLITRGVIDEVEALGAAANLWPVSYTHLTLPTNREV